MPALLKREILVAFFKKKPKHSYSFVFSSHPTAAMVRPQSSRHGASKNLSNMGHGAPIARAVWNCHNA
jgi:hypothetical protein